MATSTINITPAKRGALRCHYQGQFNPQPTFIALDLRDGAMWADYNAEITAVPMDVWHGHVRRYALYGETRVGVVNRVMREIRPLAERIRAQYEEHWNGSNHVARFADREGLVADEFAIDEIIAKFCGR